MNARPGEAHILLGMGAAVVVEEIPPTRVEDIQTDDPVIETRDPSPPEHPALRKKKKF